MKPRIILLGGCGFVGRNLVDYLITNDLVEAVRVVDKVPPQIAWLNKRQQSSFSDPRVQFQSANLINPESVKRAFRPDDNDEPFEYIVNCACETKLGQSDPVYKEGIVKLSTVCATQAALQGVKRYVELSAGHMSSNEKVASKENCKKEPWTEIARCKSQVEEKLATIPGLQYTVLRLAIVYGPGDRYGLMPRLTIGSIYKYLGECMKLLWTRDLKMNTVHVSDVCRAIWHVLTHDETVGETYNVVDQSDSTQGSISSLVSEIFNINHDYIGSAQSYFAKANLASIVEDVNDKHLEPWAAICLKDNVLNTPVSPYIDKELLDNRHLHLDGSKLVNTGFTYSVPCPTVERLTEVLEDYAQMNLFPRSLIS